MCWPNLDCAGIAAVHCGQFLVKPITAGILPHVRLLLDRHCCSAPGILIFLRHYFCKLLFWVMSWERPSMGSSGVNLGYGPLYRLG